VSFPLHNFPEANSRNCSKKAFLCSGKTEVKALPLQATSGDIGLTFSAAFRPQLLLGISILEGIGQADASFFLDLPQVSVTVEQLTNVAKTCVPSNATNNIGDALGHIFGNLTHVSPSVNLGVGVGLMAELEIKGLGPSTATEWTITSTKYPLPTACLSYNQRDGTFAPASDPPNTQTTAAASPGGSKTEKKGDSARTRNPFEGWWKKWHAYGVVLVVTSATL
jgi:hypothetical protein